MHFDIPEFLHDGPDPNKVIEEPEIKKTPEEIEEEMRILWDVSPFKNSPFKDRTLDNVKLDGPPLITGEHRRQHEDDFDMTYSLVKDEPILM